MMMMTMTMIIIGWGTMMSGNLGGNEGGREGWRVGR